MSAQLINRSRDLRRLRDDGYEISIRGGHLLVAAPYVNAAQEVKHGTFVTELTMAGDVTTRPASHVAYFIGEHPCHRDGREITRIKHQEKRQDLGNGLVVDRSFSAKPKNGYSDFYEKVATYLAIISAPAEALDSDVTARTHRATPSDGEECVFQYVDTASTHAGIAAISDKLRGQKLGIVGVGGSGSYVLDYTAKTPVDEIHLFDGDRMLQRNAFRAPGALSAAELAKRPFKAQHFADAYGKMRRGVVAHCYYIDSGNCGELESLDFVFLCVDKGSVKKPVVEHLETQGIPFIDVGMGVHAVDGRLLGIVRTTLSTPNRRGHYRQRVGFTDTEDADYARNIQIVELNALNAAHAVMRWKKLLGFYADVVNEHHSTYTIDGNMLLNDDEGDEGSK